MIHGHGIAHVTLTVSDVAKTRKFYERLFDTNFSMDNEWSFSLSKVGIPCWFTQWNKHSPDDKFFEGRIGLDHVAFRLNSLFDLEKIVEKLNEMAISNAGLQRFSEKYPYVAFRDPDNIQTEFFIPEIM
jgi:glyoxylase I family protein